MNHGAAPAHSSCLLLFFFLLHSILFFFFLLPREVASAHEFRTNLVFIVGPNVAVLRNYSWSTWRDHVVLEMKPRASSMQSTSREHWILSPAPKSLLYSSLTLSLFLSCKNSLFILVTTPLGNVCLVRFFSQSMVRFLFFQ